ncbi:MAG: TIGR02300 family protein [Rhodospirillales bacterium]
MAKSELGTKRKCPECGAPFYDLNKKQIECPKCGAAFNSTPPPKKRRPAPKPAETPAAVVPEKTKDIAENDGAEEDKKDEALIPVDNDDDDAPDEVVLDADDMDDDNDDDDDLIEDTSDLGEDDDDMSEVKEHIDNGVEDKI